jgi:hypothetical protein
VASFRVDLGMWTRYREKRRAGGFLIYTFGLSGEGIKNGERISGAPHRVGGIQQAMSVNQIDKDRPTLLFSWECGLQEVYVCTRETYDVSKVRVS